MEQNTTNINPLAKLYDYQKEAVTTTLYNPKGVVCLPTSTGKSFCMAAMLANDINMNPNQFRMYVVNAPRILLTYQLLKETFGFLTQLGIDARYMFVHSGSGANKGELNELRARAAAEGHNIPFSEIPSGTSSDSIREMMIKARNQEMPLIMFSTYHSANHIEAARQVFRTPISMVLNDEAHYLVQEQFHDILTTLTTPRCYFFTATRKHTPSDSGRGMNNVEQYGELLYEMLPREAIDIGKMVRPRLHFIRTTGVHTTQDYERSINLIIKDTFAQHEEILIKTNQKPKILISAKGSQDIRSFLNSDEYTELRTQGVDIYAVASHQEIGNDINGEHVNRQEFLRRLKEDGNNNEKRLIVLHYDILAEGIDVSGFTGIMPLRTLQKSKFLQTFGRAARLHPEDRKRLETGEIKPHELEKFNKPYAYIMIPALVHSNLDDMENIRSLISELRSYGFNSTEDIVSSTMINGIPEVDELDGLNDIIRRIPQAGELIQDMEADFEAEELAKLSKEELFDNDDGILM